MSENICDRCGDEYEPYNVFITDNPEALEKREKLNNKHEDLCKPCRMYFVIEWDIPGHAFTTESEEVEPKYDVNSE